MKNIIIIIDFKMKNIIIIIDFNMKNIIIIIDFNMKCYKYSLVSVVMINEQY